MPLLLLFLACCCSPGGMDHKPASTETDRPPSTHIHIHITCISPTQASHIWCLIPFDSIDGS